MKPQFPGFPTAGIEFLRGLEANNNREWFQEHKSVFDSAVKAPMVQLVEAFNAQIAPEYVTPPAKAIYRIYRDTRFSKDKTPYKNHIAAIFPRQGMGKNTSAGFFFSISANSIEIAGGLYMPEPDQILAMRNYILENHKQFRKIINEPKLKALLGELKGDQLTRPPKGFPADHPAADLLRFKQWIFYSADALDAAVATTPELLSGIVVRYKALLAFVDFLNKPLLPMHRKKESIREMLEL